MEAVVGADIAWLTFAIVVENFTSAIGKVIFVAYRRPVPEPAATRPSTAR